MTVTSAIIDAAKLTSELVISIKGIILNVDFPDDKVKTVLDIATEISGT